MDPPEDRKEDLLLAELDIRRNRTSQEFSNQSGDRRPPGRPDREQPLVLADVDLGAPRQEHEDDQDKDQTDDDGGIDLRMGVMRLQPQRLLHVPAVQAYAKGDEHTKADHVDREIQRKIQKAQMQRVEQGPVGESRPDAPDKALYRAHGDQQEAPEDHEVPPPRRLPNHASLPEDEDENPFDPLSDPIEPVLFASQHQDLVEPVGHIAKYP